MSAYRCAIGDCECYDDHVKTVFNADQVSSIETDPQLFNYQRLDHLAPPFEGIA